MGSSMLDLLGDWHIVAGKITYSLGVPTLSSNDGSASVADTGTGNATVTFGEAFRSAPIVVATGLKGTHSATTHNAVLVEQASTTTAEFRWLEGGSHMAFLSGSTTWDVGNLADGAGETKSLTVTGAALGDCVVVGAPYDVQDMTVTGYVQAADTVEIRVQNESGGSINLGSGSWKVVTFTPAAASVASSPDPADDEEIHFIAIGARNP